MKRVVERLRDGQITLPEDVRREIGVGTDGDLLLTVVGGRLIVEAFDQIADTARAWLEELYDMFAPVRASLEQFDEQEINAAIDEVLADVRAGR